MVRGRIGGQWVENNGSLICPINYVSSFIMPYKYWYLQQLFPVKFIRNETPPGVSFAVPGPTISCGYSPTLEEADSGSTRIHNLFHLVAIVNNFVFIS